MTVTTEKPGVVLVVDDTQAAAMALELVCGSIPGVTVRVARSAQEALRLLRESATPVRAVVTDLHMPGMDGFELIQVIRRDPLHAAARILVVSADTDPETPERVARLGADAFFYKPFSPAAVRRKLEQLLNGTSMDG